MNTKRVKRGLGLLEAEIATKFLKQHANGSRSDATWHQHEPSNWSMAPKAGQNKYCLGNTLMYGGQGKEHKI